MTRIYTDNRSGLSINTMDAGDGSGHEYVISTGDILKFQRGSVMNHGVNGISSESLISVLIHQINHLNSGDSRCRENSLAITKLEEAQMWLEKRTADRHSGGVKSSGHKQ